MNPIKRVFSEPHRMYFSAALLFLLVPMVWWGAFLFQRFEVPVVVKVNPVAIHGFGLLYGVFPLVSFGFLFTAFPKWTQSTHEVRKCFHGPWWAMVGGFALYFGQLWIGEPWGSIGAFCMFIGLLWGWAHLLRLFIAGEGFERRQPAYVLGALFGGVLGSFSMLAFQLVPIDPLYNAALAFGVYLFWPLLLLSILFRMLPFFTENKIGPIGMKSLSQTLPLLTVGLILKTGGALTDTKELWVLSDSLLLGVTLWQFYQWKFFYPKKEALLWYLYGALAWLPLVFVLGIAVGLDRLAGDFNTHLDLAGLHGLTVGLLACGAYAMLLRVTLGHSGMALKADGLSTFGYLLVQLAALMRVGIELGLNHVDGIVRMMWVPSALWLIAFGLLGLRYAVWYFRPRADAN